MKGARAKQLGGVERLCTKDTTSDMKTMNSAKAQGKKGMRPQMQVWGSEVARA